MPENDKKAQLAEMLKEMFQDGTIKIKTNLNVRNDNEISVVTEVLINDECVYDTLFEEESVSVYPPRNY